LGNMDKVVINIVKKLNKIKQGTQKSALFNKVY
jgi:hypothetical protein